MQASKCQDIAYSCKLPAYVGAISGTSHYHTSSYFRSGERRCVLPLSHYTTPGVSKEETYFVTSRYLHPHHMYTDDKLLFILYPSTCCLENFFFFLLKLRVNHPDNVLPFLPGRVPCNIISFATVPQQQYSSQPLPLG